MPLQKTPTKYWVYLVKNDSDFERISEQLTKVILLGQSIVPSNCDTLTMILQSKEISAVLFSFASVKITASIFTLL